MKTRRYIREDETFIVKVYERDPNAQNIKHYVINGWQWLGVMVGNRLCLITRLGRAGDCVRP